MLPELTIQELDEILPESETLELSGDVPFWIIIVLDLKKELSILLLIVKVTSVVPVEKITVFGLHFSASVSHIPSI
jgi:hypothetical protein